MPLKESLKDAIIRIAKEYGVRRLWLFGSSLDASTDEPNDIDLAVEGVPPSRFFEFYAKLGIAIPKDIDLIDMDSDDPMRHCKIQAFHKPCIHPIRGALSLHSLIPQCSNSYPHVVDNREVDRLWQTLMNDTDFGRIDSRSREG